MITGDDRFSYLQGGELLEARCRPGSPFHIDIEVLPNYHSGHIVVIGEPEMSKATQGVTNIDEYIRGFPQPVQQKLAQLRAIIHKHAPLANEKISYQMPTFYLNGNLVHFAAYKHHIGFYPTPSGITRFRRELSDYKSSKGAVQFPLDQPLPVELISRIVEFRVQENSRK